MKRHSSGKTSWLLLGAAGLSAVMTLGLVSMTGCGPGYKAKPAAKTTLAPRYSTLPPKDLTPVLKDSILEQSDVATIDPVQVSGWGLVVGLPGTGDSTAPMAVREYMLREMSRRGFGDPSRRGYEQMTPTDVLDDPLKRTAIVRVDALMPPGVRKGQRFDVQVSAIPESGVSSLAQGTLYQTELKVNGADPRNPASRINTQARAQGQVFINPALMLNPKEAASEQRSRLGRRIGIIPGGGISGVDQPLVLRVRAPQFSLARRIEQRIDQHFQNPAVAQARDEGIVHIFVPENYRGDWERFAGVCLGLYFDTSPEFAAARATQLAEEALKPGAPLLEISYAWEGLGPVAVSRISKLMDFTNPPDVQYAAARAAAFIGDEGGVQALQMIATAEGHDFQVEAVRSLGALPPTTSTTARLRELLNSGSAVVRVEAYKILAERGDATVYARNVGDKFWLDVVLSEGPTMVFATRSGVPRIAVIGRGALLRQPITFLAMDDRLSLSSSPRDAGLTIFYRNTVSEEPVKVVTRPMLADVIGWLGGAGEVKDQKLPLSYAEVVAVVQALADEGRIIEQETGKQVAMLLQEAPEIADDIATAPPIFPGGRGRPQGEGEPAENVTPDENQNKDQAPADGKGETPVTSGKID